MALAEIEDAKHVVNSPIDGIRPLEYVVLTYYRYIQLCGRHNGNADINSSAETSPRADDYS
jgi:hypothetical protein